MASKRTIKRILLATVWTAITGGVLTLLVAANGREQKHNCKEVLITIHGTGERYYINKADIAAALNRNGDAALEGQPTEAIDLAQLEKRLEQNAWIKSAELYFDRANYLHVVVTERQPIARVFATNGRSFYIDSAGARLPLLPHISARVPVVTNYPSASRPLPKDSAVLQEVRKVLQYVSASEFWSAQIAQVDITPTGRFELLPTVGNHTIRLGNAENLEDKLNRLMVVYRQVLSKAGFDKYSVLDIQYAGQVVAVHRGERSSVDSAQLKNNIAALLQTDQMMKAHKAAEAVAEKEPAAATEANKAVGPTPETKPAAAKVEPAKPEVKQKPPTVQTPVASKTEKAAKERERKKEITRKEIRKSQPPPKQLKPKAVMPKRKDRT